ncbi:hypothetical protein PV328_002372 [Microctonus aethiopoides]|uniref:Uncharacterized protein n=1 Tax=Microctonus aethiopoides TaxID=144406 RepID=A0AA39FZ89_9HYME|nr:hypothetical protein PV328_002372 [Microctonus aethiopoides]
MEFEDKLNGGDNETSIPFILDNKSETSQSSSQQASTSFPLSKASSMRAPSFLIDRRLSEAEIRRRHMWLQKTRLSIAKSTNEVNAIDVSVKGNYIASGGKDAALRLYDAESAKLIHVYKRNDAEFIDDKIGRYHRMRIFAVKFHQSYPDLMITGGWDDTVRVWDRRVGTGSTLVIKGPHICGDAIDVKETQIITGSWVVRASLQLWDMTSGKLIDSILPKNRPTSLDGEFLYAVQYFDGDCYGDHVLTGGSGTSAVEVINLKEKKVVGNFEVHKAVMTLDSNKTSIIFGGMESVIRLADFS